MGENKEDAHQFLRKSEKKGRSRRSHPSMNDTNILVECYSVPHTRGEEWERG